MINELKAKIEKQRFRAAVGQRLWSFAHHAATFGAVSLSLGVAGVSEATDFEIQGLHKEKLIVIASVISAILAAIAAKGGFERKWITNRMTRSKLELLQLDLLGDKVNTDDIRNKLKLIISEHDIEIVSENK